MEEAEGTTEEIVEETPTTETPETEEQIEDTSEPMTIEELLALDEEDYEEFTDDANHTGMKPLHEWMEHIPEDVRKHVANLRASYTRKTQEIAEMRKQLEAERQALLQQQELTLNNPYLNEAQKHITEEENDLYTPEGMQAENQEASSYDVKRDDAASTARIADETKTDAAGAIQGAKPRTDARRIPYADCQDAAGASRTQTGRCLLHC